MYAISFQKTPVLVEDIINLRGPGQEILFVPLFGPMRLVLCIKKRLQVMDSVGSILKKLMYHTHCYFI